MPNAPVRVLKHEDFVAAEAALAEATALLARAGRERRRDAQIAFAARAYEHALAAQRTLGRAACMSARSRALEAVS